MNFYAFLIKKNDNWIIEENQGFSFFIMIHCDKELYQKVLGQNLSNIENIAIIGNSLSKYNDNLDLILQPQILIFKAQF